MQIQPLFQAWLIKGDLSLVIISPGSLCKTEVIYCNKQILIHQTHNEV